MARRRKSNPGWDELAIVLTIGFVAIWFIIKWIFEAIVFLGACLVKLVEWISKKVAQKKKTNIIMKEPFKNTIIKEETLKAPISDIKEKLNLFDKSKYDDEFPIQIRARGESYYSNDKIKYFKQSDNKYSCIVKGTEDYKVSVIFNGDKIEESSCTCPYFADKNNNCKHIYALIYKIKCDENKDKIINEINENIQSIKTMINNSQGYIDRNKSHFTESALNEYNNYIHAYDWQFKNIESKANKETLEDTLLKYLENLIHISSELKEKINKTLNSENSSNNYVNTSSTKSTKSTTSVGDAIVGMALLDAITNKEDEDDYNESGYTDDELDDYGLEDWQKDLVKKGDYDPWNFEEEDLEEDDYYYEDD